MADALSRLGPALAQALRPHDYTVSQKHAGDTRARHEAIGRRLRQSVEEPLAALARAADAEGAREPSQSPGADNPTVEHPGPPYVLAPPGWP